MSDATPVLDTHKVARFGELLRGQPRRRLGLETIWRSFADAFPARPQGTEERAWLRAALDALTDGGVLRLPAPSKSGWDRSQLPALPAFVTVVTSPVPARDDAWRRHPWHPALAWVPNLKTLPADQVAFLLRVHDGLRDRRFAEPAPLKYRSLQLTGHEKRLQELAKGALFGPNRLSLELLGCLPHRLPLAMTRVGTAPVVLLFENAGPYEVAMRVLGGNQSASYGWVAYGDGARVEQAITWLCELDPRPRVVAYVGDLDVVGLEIPNRASVTAIAAGLPPLSPAPGFHAAMLAAAATLGEPLGWSHAEGRNARPHRALAPELLRWLPEDVRPAVRKVLASGRRIPEEVLGPLEMRSVLFA